MQERMLPDIAVGLEIPADAVTGELFYIAAAPADYRLTFTGSALPQTSFEAAIQGTPNRGMVHGVPGELKNIKLYCPNSYRDDEHGKVMPPCIPLAWETAGGWKTAWQQVASRIPYRALTDHPLRKLNHELFYEGTHELPVRSQEHLIRQCGYPLKNVEPTNPWGLRPRL